MLHNIEIYTNTLTIDCIQTFIFQIEFHYSVFFIQAKGSQYYKNLYLRE